MPIETRSNNALFRRAEQLKRWEESDTNKVSPEIPHHKKSKIKFSDGCVFLAACAASDTEEVERLLEQGADINTANVDGLTALHQACIDDNLDMVQFLVEHGCDVNQGDNEGWTPLHATASCGFVSIAKYLIEHGADVAAVNNDGDLPIDIAESPKMEELLSDILDEKGIDCDEARYEEERVMLEDANQWLNSQKYQDRIHPRTGASALHVAAAKGYIKVMNVLIKAGADLNAQDNDGWTSLHAAAHWGQKEACAILADNLANMDIQNFVGQTCFDVAEPELVKLLEELKKKQTSMQKDRPEIQAILQRTSSRPPLKRRTSVTRMSGEEKSKSAMKDTKSERAQIYIEHLTLPEEEVEDDKGTSTTCKKQEILQDISQKKDPVERIPSWKKMLRRASENLADDGKGADGAEVLTKKPKNTETDEKPHNNEESNGPAGVIQHDESATLKKNWILSDLSKHSLREVPVINRDVSPIPSSPSDASLDSQSEGKRSFVPPARDEESELQRKAHAKRVRETRRSTQGVLLEDVKTAELQYIIKVTQEARSCKVDEDDSDEMEENVKCATNDKELKQEYLPYSENVDDHDKAVKEEERVNKPTSLSESINSNEQNSSTNKSSNPSSPDASSSVTSVLKTKTANNSDEQSSLDSRSALGTQAAIQRRRRPKRRSTGVVHLDSDDGLEDKGSIEINKSVPREKDQKEEMVVCEKLRQAYGSSSCPDISSDTTSLCETLSRHSSLSSGKDSLDDETDLNYRKLYEEMKKENERLKAFEKENEQLHEALKKAEDELERAKKLIKKMSESNNSRNSISETEKKERRALERKLSEMEEEVKNIAKLKTENEKLKAENRALSRVVCKLSK